MNGVVVESIGEIVEFLDKAGCREGPVSFGVGGSSLEAEVCGEKRNGVLQQEKVMGSGGDQGMFCLGVGRDEEDVRGAVFGACGFPGIERRGGSVGGEEERDAGVATVEEKSEV